MPLAPKVVSATRLHFPPGTATLPEVSIQNLKNYAISIHNLGIVGAVAVNCLEAEVTKTITEAAPGVDVQVLHVPVWGAFVLALNTLLGEAQRRRSQYVLYQSLEVLCTREVLRKLLDHFTPDTLVVGPVLDGHIFQPGEQPLNGRTTPWNTLALWSTRKLGLTGFLNIADGMPDVAKSLAQQITGEEFGEVRQLSDDSLGLGDDTRTMGSSGWWEKDYAGFPHRQLSVQAAVPAGVEEVTAIALLQHLLGESRARAVLLQLPEDLESLVTWKTNFDDDTRRAQWHEYKMKSKVTRPAAQIKQLLGRLNRPSLPSLKVALLPCLAASPTAPQDQGQLDPQLKFGIVQHYGESIRPPPQVEMICLASVALFSANFASAFSSAFQSFNAGQDLQDRASISVVTFVSLLIGGVYIPMPLSLFLTRWVTLRADHIAGLVLFAGAVLVANASTALLQANGHPGYWQELFYLAARFLAGLGSGVLFQTRFLLASTSTQDHHLELQARTFFFGDLGLGIGALIPYAASALAGRQDLSAARPEFLSSVVLALLSLALLLWMLASFPWHLQRLPDRVRFQATAEEETSVPTRTRLALWTSGTIRVFVQSAALAALALWMRGAGLTGHFRQTRAVAALSLLPVPFEAVASGVFVGRCLPKTQERARCAAIVAVGTVVVLFWCSGRVGGDMKAHASLAAMELAILLITLACVEPRNVTSLNQRKDAERSMVMLEWLKAYVGRLLGPVAALAIQNWLGFGPLLALLCCATVAVALTA